MDAEMDLCIEFGNGAFSVGNELNEFPSGTPCLTFGDVGWDRNCCAPNLSHEAKSFFRREACGEPIEYFCEFDALFPDNKIPVASRLRISMYHAIIIATLGIGFRISSLVTCHSSLLSRDRASDCFTNSSPLHSPSPFTAAAFCAALRPAWRCTRSACVVK